MGSKITGPLPLPMSKGMFMPAQGGGGRPGQVSGAHTAATLLRAHRVAAAQG
jgi:hypothetical protein